MLNRMSVVMVGYCKYVNPTADPICWSACSPPLMVHQDHGPAERQWETWWEKYSGVGEGQGGWEVGEGDRSGGAELL